MNGRGRMQHDWTKHWVGMPEFVQKKKREYAKITVRFRNQADLDDFCLKIGQRLNAKSQCTWHPELVGGLQPKEKYVDQSTLPNLHTV